MAPLPIIPNVYRVAQNWRDIDSGQIATNVMHFETTTGGSAGVAAAVDAAWTTDQNQAIANTAHIIDYHVTALDGSSATIIRTATGVDAGQQDGASVPSAAAVVSFYTALRGRSYRGRYFAPFVAEAVISDGVIDSTPVADMVTGWTAFATALETSSITHVVASYKHSTAQAITSYVVQAAYGTQRRRQTRVRYP